MTAASTCRQAGCLRGIREAKAFPWQARRHFCFHMTLSDILAMLERDRTWRSRHFLPRTQGLAGRKGKVLDPSVALSWVSVVQ